ncbi:MAG TPA: peptidylprolyl isomerase SurA [Steroidobacteraceae bacterium]|jgi:peptidyl-prolyl cis-trans isomerase SurA|nr:peptidylprolyl isomerase SurA [Steroidobacteraceae bacterium]
MRLSRLLIPSLALLSGVALAQTRELATSGVLLDRVAAVVNDGVVLKSEVDAQTQMITERLQQQHTELPPANVLRQQILERLVLQEIQLQRADRGGVKVSDEMLNNALKDVAERNHIHLDQLPTALESQGINYAAYRDSVRKEMTITLLRQRDVLTKIIVTPREVEQYLAKQSTSIENQEFNVSHILLSLPQAATPGQLEEVSARAQDIYQRAKKGEDFAQLAVTYSNSQTALDGGSLGWRKGPQLPGFVADLVSKMQPGDIAEPVRTPSGFHIIKLNEKRGADEQVMVNQVHVRHILMRTNELQDDATVRQKLEAIRQRILNGEDFTGLAQVTSEDPGSAADGGDLGWAAPNTFAPEFAKVVSDLKENEISEPFQTQFGWHIAQLLGTRTHDNTDEVRRQRAYVALRDSKADEETELWLRRLRDEAFVEYKM